MGSYAPRQEVTLVVVVVSTICFSIICCEDATRVCSRSPAPSQILYQSNDVIPESRCKSPNRSGQPDTTTRYQDLIKDRVAGNLHGARRTYAYYSTHNTDSRGGA